MQDPAILGCLQGNQPLLGYQHGSSAHRCWQPQRLNIRFLWFYLTETDRQTDRQRRIPREYDTQCTHIDLSASHLQLDGFFLLRLEDFSI